MGKIQIDVDPSKPLSMILHWPIPKNVKSLFFMFHLLFRGFNGGGRVFWGDFPFAFAGFICFMLRQLPPALEASTLPVAKCPVLNCGSCTSTQTIEAWSDSRGEILDVCFLMFYWMSGMHWDCDCLCLLGCLKMFEMFLNGFGVEGALCADVSDVFWMTFFKHAILLDVSVAAIATHGWKIVFKRTKRT